MSGAALSLRDWLLTDTPGLASQAAWGRRYRLWRDFRVATRWRWRG